MKLLFLLVFIAGWILESNVARAQTGQPAQNEWNKTVEAGKKEGKVVVSVPASAELRKDVERIVKQRFGIETELIAGRAASIVGKIQQEARAGVYNFDLHMGGSESMVTGLLSEGLLEPFEPAMTLPEVRDPKNWWGGHIWVDNAKRYIYSSQAYLTENLWYNTDLVKLRRFAPSTTCSIPSGSAKSVTSTRVLRGQAPRSGPSCGSLKAKNI